MGDCWLVAALASIAHMRSDIITNMIKDHPENGTVDVIFQRELLTGIFRKETYTIKKSLFKKGDNKILMSDSKDTIWDQMIEKAYSAYLKKGNKPINYNSIYSGGYEDKYPFKVILGKEAKGMYNSCALNGDIKNLYYKIKSALNNKIPFWYSVSNNGNIVKDIDGNNIISNHAFSIMDAYKKGDRYYMILRNPWGDNNSKSRKRSAYITVDLKEATNAEFNISNLDFDESKPIQEIDNPMYQNEDLDVVVMGKREILFVRDIPEN